MKISTILPSRVPLSSFFQKHGLDPVPVGNAYRYNNGTALLTVESYSWGKIYQAAKAGRSDTVVWIVGKGSTPIPKGLPSWCASIFVSSHRPEKSVSEIHQKSIEAGSLTQTIRDRLKSAQKRKLGGQKRKVPVSHRHAIKFIRSLSNRLGRTLSRTQGGARDGDLFYRDHYSNSKYITLLVRDGNRVRKVAQLWPLSRKGTFHVQLYVTNDNFITKMTPLGCEVSKWKDGRQSYVIKHITEYSMPFAVKYTHRQLENDNAL